jgi:SAM-dependent methyltransferase
MTSVAMGAVAPVTPVPLRLPGDAIFARARDVLRRMQFTEPAICVRAGIDSIYAFQERPDAAVEDALDVLMRLFLDDEPVDAVVAQSRIPAADADALEALGLVRRDDDATGCWRATVRLYPTRDFFVASDLGRRLEGAGPVLAPDAVYPAISESTRAYLDALPATPCKRFVEMCGGTGIAALVASRYADHVWSLDITERATRFAEFNARLNGVDHLTALAGDAYAPVEGLTFDRIVAHPPYVAAAETTMIYRDGGPDGERVTRAILAGLPRHLEPGGSFYCTCFATDREHAPLEQRIREMIGPGHEEFDVGVCVRDTYNPTEYYCRLAYMGRGTFAAAEQRHHAFKAQGIARLVHCSFEVRRHAEPCSPVTFRSALGAMAPGDALGWMIAWQHACVRPGFDEAVLAMRPVATGHVRLRSVQRLDHGAWEVEQAWLSSTVPFGVTGDCATETATFLSRCDGSQTLRELIRELRLDGVLDRSIGDDVIVSTVKSLIGVGALEVEAFPLPRAGE